jgi:hypothetical protein
MIPKQRCQFSKTQNPLNTIMLGVVGGKRAAQTRPTTGSGKIPRPVTKKITVETKYYSM